MRGGIERGARAAAYLTAAIAGGAMVLAGLLTALFWGAVGVVFLTACAIGDVLGGGRDE